MSSDALKKDKKENEEKLIPQKIEINTLFNPLTKGELYQASYSENDIELLSQKLKKRKEKKEEEKEYNFKERIIYNNLPEDYITKKNNDSTNIYYFQNFFEQIEDFDYKNFLNLINMRKKYLKSLFDQNKENNKGNNEEKKENEKKEEKENFENEDELKNKDTLFSLLADLADMMNYQQDKGDILLYYSILERIISNIFFEIDILFVETDINKHALYENKLCECIDLYEKNFLSKDEDINNKTIHFLYQLQKLSLSFKSCGAFLKVLKLMKSKNIAFDNYKSIYEKYFKFDKTNLNKKRKENNINNSKIFEIMIKEDISSFEFCCDDNYLYICYDSNNKKYYKLEKYDLITKKKIIEKEINIYLDFCLMNDYKNNKIDILAYKNEKEFELLIVNKFDFSIEKKIQISSNIERKEYVQMVTSQSNFYLITENQIYILDISKLNKSLIFNNFISLKKRLKKDKSYHFILDDYINFSCSNIINLQKKEIEESLEENTKETERNYFDNFNNILYSLRYIKGKKLIEINKYIFEDFKLRMINSNKEINEIEKNIDNCLSILTNNYHIVSSENSEDDTKKIDPFKHYLDYSINFDSILNFEDNKALNDEKNNYKIDKELSDKYYLLLYYSLIKNYHYSSGKSNSKKNKLIINIKNDIMFNIVKEIVIEQKDYILLFIYCNFITEDENYKSEKLDQKINWIVKFCLEQEKISPYVFEILREIYKYNPKYINSTNIAKDLISSTKLTFEERILYFSLISLEENKELFPKLLEKFLYIEKQIILSNDENISYSKILFNEVCENFINYFQNPKIYRIDDNEGWDNFKKILEIFINYYNSIINEITKEEKRNENNYLLIKNSVVCQVLFLLINILICQNEKIIENKRQIEFFKLLLKTLYITEKYNEEEKKIGHYLEKEEILIVTSESFYFPEQIDYILPTVNRNVNIEYDCDTNYPCKLTIDKFPQFEGCPKDIGQSELFLVPNISIFNDINVDSKKLKGHEYMRFKIKFSDFKKDESNFNILINIRKSILFYILISSIISYKSKQKKSFDDKKEEINIDIIDNKLNEIVKSQFFKDISIISNFEKNKNKNMINEINYFDFDLNEIIDNKQNNLSEDYQKNYVKIINLIFEDEELKNENNINIININPSINSITENLLKNESHKKLISLIHQEFIKKNPWGKINEELLSQIIVSLFSIIIYEFNLFSDFEELVQLNNNNKLILDNDKLKTFIKIYTKLNQLKKALSKKKQDFSILKDIKEKEEEDLLNKYITSIKEKINLIIENKKRKENNEKKNLNFEIIEKTISFLLNYITDDRVTASLIKEKIENLNEKAINKERILNYLNKILYISKKAQDIKDIIFTINSIIKNGKTNLCGFDEDLLGADESLINNYKKQVFTFILQIINQVKTLNSDNYDITFYFTLIQSLFWPFSNKDHKFIKMSQFYEILNFKFRSNKFNDLLLRHNSNNLFTLNYNESQFVFRLSYDTLYKEAFYLFKFMAFMAINQFPNVNNNDNEQIPILKYIFDIIIDILNAYINYISIAKQGVEYVGRAINEEKLNCFLIIFYRAILKNNRDIMGIIQKYYNNILSILFQILCYSSSKNKLICLKIIEKLLINNNKIDELFLVNNYETFKNELNNNKKLYNFIYSNKGKHIENIFIEFLFNLALLLQQNIDNLIKYINGTENNMALSLIIIKIIQNKIIKNDNSIIYNEIMKFIELNYSNPKFLSLILQILGVDLNYLHIGSYIELEKEKKGIILGFNNNLKKNDSYNFNDINYSKGEYIYYINENNIYKDFLINLDLIFETSHVNNLKIISDNKPILPLEKNKPIYEYLIENITKYDLKDIYLILRYIKILLLEENIKLNDKIVSYIMTKSLNKEVLQFKCKIITLEKLEKLMTPYICESNPSIFLEEEEKIKKDDNIPNDDGGEALFVDPNSPDILFNETSLCYRCGEEHSLAFSLQYKKIFNYENFVTSKKFLKIFNNIGNAKNYKEKCILMIKELSEISEIPKNVSFIIISDGFKDEDKIKTEMRGIPVIMLDGLEYKNIYENTFEQKSFPELENLFMKSLDTDVSLLIEIPIEKIPDFAENQRDTLVEILNEEPNYESKKDNDENDNENEDSENNIPNYEEFKNILCGKSINDIDKNLIFNKLISLICRRMIIIVKMTQKTKLIMDDLKNLVKLLQYENLIENSKDVEIVNILKNFVLIVSTDDDVETIKCFTDLKFLDSKNLVNDKDVKDIETENDLLKYENLNNNMFLVDWFFICQYSNNKTNILDKQFVIDYVSKLMNKNENNMTTFLLRIFKHIEKNIENYIQIIEKNKNVFCSKELIQMFDSCEKKLKEGLKEDSKNSLLDFSPNLYENIELFFTFFNISYKLKLNYNIDLDTNYFENSTLLNIYKILSLLIYFNEDVKSDVNYYNFVELFYQKGLYKYLIDCDQFSKPLQKIKMNYYDKSFNSNFVMNFQNLIPQNLKNGINNLYILLKGVDDNLVNIDNCVFFYESEKCKHLQDYIKIFDRPNDKRILLIKDNFTISYPNKNFLTFLYGAGSNDKNSLGIQIGNKEKFATPQACVGLEECKNIIDFKFGYYHTFVQSADGNLFTCGTDKGSSFRYTNVEFPFFNKQTYFHSLAKENGGIKVIAANNFNSSILLTNNNKLFCCGKNNASCLGNSIEGENEIAVPNEMPEFLPVIKEISYPYIVKEIACGYKSTLFLLEEGYAFTCGSQDFRQCGSKENVSGYREYFPLYPPRGTKFTHVVAGEEFFLLLVEEVYDKNYGKLYSLGQNEFGRSGVGEISTNYTLQRLEEVEDKYFYVISSRNENAAAISTEGELFTFGNNGGEALGLGNTQNMYVPTKVEALNDYICDNVGISQNHIVIIARNRKTGKKSVFSCGENQYNALCIENQSQKVHLPTEIKFFLENRPDEEPIRASLSRYQTYLMSIKVNLSENINKILNDFKCSKCNQDNQYNIYFNIDENKKINYYCNKCVLEDNKKIFYVLNTIDDDTKNNIKILLSDKDKINELCLSFEEYKDKKICSYCNKDILDNIYQSYSNEKIILCEKCYMTKCPLIEYPQLFITYNSTITPKNGNNKSNVDSILYPNIVKNEKPYIELEVHANYKKEYIKKKLFKNKELNILYNSIWKLINKDILKEMRKLKEFYEYDKFNYIIEKKDEEKREEEKRGEEKKEEDKKEDKKEEEKKDEKKEEEKKEDKKKEEKKDKKERKIIYKNYEYLANIAGKSNKYLIYEIVSKLIDLRDKTDIKNEDFKNLDLYKKNKKLYLLAFELSNRINDQIFKILELSIRFQFPTIFKKIIESSLEFITTQERREIFQRNIEKDRTSISLENNEIVLSRIKANLFYEKNELDKEGTHTVFCQLFRKTKNYAKKNYLSKRNHRLFSVKLQGEGASDFSGVYNEIISIISFELQSKYLDLFIKTPNNKNEIGLNRDKYIPNPLAKSQLHKDMFYFLGNLMLHAITSGNVLNLDLHPIFYKKLLNHKITFNEIETLDKLSYKFILSLEAIKDEKEFKEKHNDLYFAVHSSSDNSLIELIKDGQTKKVTFDKLPEYIKLYKEFLMNEIDEQVSIIHKGIFDILKENLSSLLTPQDLEEYICGSPKLNLQLLREKTRYDTYEQDTPVVVNFWKVLESFTEEEKSKYLKFVSGRTRLPDPRNIPFEHKIALYHVRNPDKRMPTSSTCYFTLNLPNYSSYEILRDKLRYVINNCSSIDADFFPDDGGNEFADE